VGRGEVEWGVCFARLINGTGSLEAFNEHTGRTNK
jgi:hypothetical protein